MNVQDVHRKTNALRQLDDQPDAWQALIAGRRWKWARRTGTTGVFLLGLMLKYISPLTPAAVIGHYCGRWNIETTFQEVRSCLDLESTRGWCAKTVQRAGPCLLGLYTVVAILFNALPKSKRVGGVVWPGKAP